MKRVIAIKNEKVNLEVELSKQKDIEPIITLEPVKKIFERGITMQNEFLEGDDEKKQEILKIALWNLSIKGKEIVTRQYKSPYDVIANLSKNLSISNLLGYKDSNLDTQDQNLMSYH